MRFDIITIFPKIFNSYSARSAEQGSAGLAGSYLNESILGRAQKNNLIEIDVHDLRDYSSDKHKRVDDKPYGGGAGMIFMVEPIFRAVKKISKLSFPRKRESADGIPGQARNDREAKRRIILFSAKGKTMDQSDVRRWAKYDQLILICGRYEGVDERVAEYIVDEEVSVGNYILTGGEIPAMIVVDAVSRLIPGVINKESLKEESFSSCLRTIAYGLPQKNQKAVVGPLRQGDSEASSRLAASGYLEHPQYTRPENFRGWKVPKVLLSGNHGKIKKWREDFRK